MVKERIILKLMRLPSMIEEEKRKGKLKWPKKLVIPRVGVLASVA